MDELGTFSIPVTEAYPEIATTYKKRILHPMDFRTIEQVRLSSYKSITELQDDLILVFRNCMEYNEPGSPVYAAAR